jgi:uncharacterized protein involved in exopolysaccharide biosynthesis
MANEIEELRKKLGELTKEAERLERRISLLPKDHPLRVQTESALAAVRRELETTFRNLYAGVPKEVAALREELEGLTRDISKRFVELEATIMAAPVGLPERVKRMSEEIEALRDRITATTLALGYGIPMGMAWKRLYETRLWDERIRKGEVEITESFTSARNKFTLLHHKPTCETYLDVKPLRRD